MKNLQYRSFLMGIIVYLMYSNVFEVLLSLNDVLLFNFQSNERTYIFGLVASLILTNGILFLLYTFFVKTDIRNTKIITAVITLSGIILISMGINYYLAHFDYSSIVLEKNKSLDIYREYYETRSIIYFSNTFLVMVILLLGLKRKFSSNSYTQ